MPRRRPNFDRLDGRRPEVAAIVEAMVSLRRMVGERAWAAAYEPVDDGWWREVLHDPRARWPVREWMFAENSRWAHLRLDRHPFPTVRVVCAFCRRSHEVPRAELIREHGGRHSVVRLQSMLMPKCKYRRNDGCAAVISWTR